jgi:6-phosphogluconolactonase/glucosamine-6-phosphate isomerase/deaminase
MIFYNKNSNWKKKIEQFIIKKHRKKKIDIILTGGKSVRNFYKYFKNKQFLMNYNVNIFLSDERITSNKKYLNSELIKKYFKKKKNVKIFLPMISSVKWKKYKTIKSYNDLIPKKIDFSILSLGSDGHIASIFKNDLIRKNIRKIIFTKSTKAPYRRISISPEVIKNIKDNIILVFGNRKIKLLKKIIADNSSYPCKIIDNPNWFCIRT